MIHAEVSLTAFFPECPCRSGRGRLLQHALDTHRESWRDHLATVVRGHNGSLVFASIEGVELDGCAVRAELHLAVPASEVVRRIMTACAEGTASFDFSCGDLDALQESAIAEIELAVSDLSRFTDWTLNNLLEHGSVQSVPHILDEIRSVTKREFCGISAAVFSGVNTVWRYEISG